MAVTACHKLMQSRHPVKAREFAEEVVRQLRAAGYESLWAGGCVRDELMGREPKDYDVATNATPPQIRDVFGRRRTLPIGASFGVITVLGREQQGQIDVATFRRDAGYSDGRHPDRVEFCDAQEDAQRRDFTINGLFFDPVEQRVLDYVGGQADLDRCVIRAIGDPAARIAEDKLRMLRAVRFASTLGFEIDAGTWAAVSREAPGIRTVSAERITEELRRMLIHPDRPRAIELLRDSGLLHEIFPEMEGVLPRLEPAAESQALAWDRTLRILEHLIEPSFAVAFAVLCREIWLARGADTSWFVDLCRRMRFANDVGDTARFCLQHEALVREAGRQPWPRLQRVLIHRYVSRLLDFADAVARVLDPDVGQVELCRRYMQLPSEQLNPPPLIRGDDLLALGLPKGPLFRDILEQARDAQLLRQLSDRASALEWVRQRWGARLSS
ncbi:MAG: CCA tRNA nucleotidyltransferase [Pirellulaceae bacterium]